MRNLTKSKLRSIKTRKKNHMILKRRVIIVLCFHLLISWRRLEAIQFFIIQVTRPCRLTTNLSHLRHFGSSVRYILVDEKSLDHPGCCAGQRRWGNLPRLVRDVLVLINAGSRRCFKDKPVRNHIRKQASMCIYVWLLPSISLNWRTSRLQDSERYN